MPRIEQLLDSVLLAGEYIVPKRHQQRHEHTPDDGLAHLADSAASNRKTLLIGGTHEHAVTMAELEAPPDIEKASALLMDKMLAMYPALMEDGWRPSQCNAGEHFN